MWRKLTDHSFYALRNPHCIQHASELLRKHRFISLLSQLAFHQCARELPRKVRFPRQIRLRKNLVHARWQELNLSIRGNIDAKIIFAQRITVPMTKQKFQRDKS